MNTSLKAIAQKFNTSIATVSRVVNHKPGVSEDLRKKINTYISQINYKPNSNAVALKKNKSQHLIAVITPYIDHDYFSRLIKGISSLATKENYGVLLGETQHSTLLEEELIDNYLEIGVECLFFIGGRKSNIEGIQSKMAENGVIFILLDRLYNDYKGHYLTFNGIKGAYLATEHFILNSGIRDIAYIGTSEKSPLAIERKVGYLNALEAHNIPIRDEYIFLTTVNDYRNAVENGKVAMEQFNKLESKPKAVFCATDNLALGVYEYVNLNSLRIPDDIAVIGFSNSKTSQFVQPRMSTVDQNSQSLGELAFKVFKDIRKSSSSKLISYSIEPELIIRQSCGDLH